MRDQRTIDKEPAVGYDPCNLCPTPWLLVDNDCDGYADCDDSDCLSDPACVCLPQGSACDADAECCSNKCRGGKCR
jgi:hypothetical protein